MIRDLPSSTSCLCILDKYCRGSAANNVSADSTKEQDPANKTPSNNVDGVGEISKVFHQSRLLDQITIIMMPRLIGDYPSFFDGTQHARLTPEECTHWGFGLV